MSVLITRAFNKVLIYYVFMLVQYVIILEYYVFMLE